MDITALAAALAIGKITEESIRKEFGDDVLGRVLAIGGGLLVGQASYKIIDALNPLDDLMDIF